jgi:hypothetical protein
LIFFLLFIVIIITPLLNLSVLAIISLIAPIGGFLTILRGYEYYFQEKSVTKKEFAQFNQPKFMLFVFFV